MSAIRLHLVRHGEVDNPRGVLYSRLPGFNLSERGAQMASLAAAALPEGVTRLISSPLERAQQSAKPIAERFGLKIETDIRVIEPHNQFQGKKMKLAVLNPKNWKHLTRPSQPSWGESYTDVLNRMTDALTELWHESDGEVAIVSHQMPIWITHLAAVGEPLKHNPARRRCALSSITSFELLDGRLVEVSYQDPAAELLSVDKGAV
ncbi:MAG: histidine phosphatase family protein [Microbacteriaceae bacterium]|nr:histidine phosphatase family protein [Microbacteriaceae bacterium]